MEILIVEDEVRIANTLKKSFIKEGHLPTTAYTAEEAIDLLRERVFDIILLDWRLPKLSGMELCKQMRANGDTTPIVLLTALTDISNKIEALETGADDYITKPFSFEEILARINAVLRRYRANQNKIQFDDMNLNLIERTIESENEVIKLSDREFELLKYFLYNKGSILNKEKICKEVWGIEYNPFTNVIEVTVKNLRKKLEQNSKHNFIKTIYGEGYLFIAE